MRGLSITSVVIAAASFFAASVVADTGVDPIVIKVWISIANDNKD